jgi:ArsR family transcriptional regulator
MQRALDILAALSDPTRLRIMLLVRDMELAMGELADVLGQSQPRVSRHVRILADAGLVRRQKEGAWVFVALDSRAPAAEVEALIERLLGGADPCAVERGRLAQVRAERQKAVDSWFEAHAAEWDWLRRLEGPAGGIDGALLAAATAGRPVGRLLDIGTGTGSILELLGPHAARATGVDRSPGMLRLARAKIDGLPDSEVRQADMRALPFDDGSFDTVVMHQVLHFADDPAAVVGEAARVAAAGGRLLVADYAAHRHEELRSRLQHQRLGFEPGAVSAWMAAAGLEPRIAATAAGTGLTSILWEGRRP